MSSPPDVRARRAGVAVALAVAVTGVAVALVALGRGAAPFARLGVSAPADLVVITAPVARLASTLSAGACVGMLLVAVIARPTTDGARGLGARGYRVLRRAGAAAAVWALAAITDAVMVVLVGVGGNVEVLGRPGAFVDAATALEEPVALILAAVGAVVVAATCAVTVSWRTTVAALAVAALGVAAPAATGQVAGSGAGHDIATDAAVLAALAAAVWFGTVLAAALDPDGTEGPGHGRAASRARPVVAGAAAVALVGTVVAEGVLTRGDWLGDAHGRWATARLVLLLGAAAASLPSAARRRPVLAPVLLVLAGGAGAAAALEPAPALGSSTTIQDVLLGFELDPPSVLGLLGPGRLSLLFTVLATALALAYLAGLTRLRRRGDAWPPGRTAAWLGGCALWVWTTSSGLGAQSMGMFSAHMGTHMLLSMLVPVLLVLGGPLTLALRALPAAARRTDTGGADVVDGPREWLLSLAASPVARTLTHPLVSLAVFVGSFYALYFSSLFSAALPYHWAHQLMILHFVGSGYLFFWPVVGVDVGPRPLPHIGRLALLLASMPFHTFFGVALLGADELIGNRFYRELSLPWVPDLPADQSLAGGIAWAAGEGPLLIVLVVLLVQWSRHDRRESDRADRQADRDGDGELAAWNAMLADLARGR